MFRTLIPFASESFIDEGEEKSLVFLDCRVIFSFLKQTVITCHMPCLGEALPQKRKRSHKTLEIHRDLLSGVLGIPQEFLCILVNWDNT